MNQNNQAIAQLLTMAQPQQAQQQPLMLPPVGGASTGGGGAQPMQDPMQGFAQLAEAGAGAMQQQNMAGRNNAFPEAPMGGGGLFGMLKNPMANYSMGGGLY